MRERRRESRTPFAAPIHITWNDGSGTAKFARARCVEISGGGMRIETSEVIPEGTCLSRHLGDVSLSEWALVRHVTPRDGKYILGLEMFPYPPNAGTASPA